jgi:hypothetical protein
MVTKVSNWATLDWTYSILHGTNNTWHHPYTSGVIMHLFATIREVNILSAAEHLGTHKNTMCSVGSLKLWRSTSIAICCWLYSHLAFNSRLCPLALTKMDCDDVDIGLDFILPSQGSSDSHSAWLYRFPEACSLVKFVRAKNEYMLVIRNLHFFKDMYRCMCLAHHGPVDANIF